MRKLFIILIFSSIFQVAIGQDSFDIKGVLKDCADNKALVYGIIFLQQDDNTIATTYSDDKGNFIFKNLSPGFYKIKPHYYYYPAADNKIYIPANERINICLSADNPDSLLANYKAGNSHLLYHFGMSKYSEKELNIVGKNYELRWIVMGCIVDENLEKYNKMIFRILEKKYGGGWEKRFWSEVKHLKGQK